MRWDGVEVWRSGPRRRSYMRCGRQTRFVAAAHAPAERCSGYLPLYLYLYLCVTLQCFGETSYQVPPLY